MNHLQKRSRRKLNSNKEYNNYNLTYLRLKVKTTFELRALHLHFPSTRKNRLLQGLSFKVVVVCTLKRSSISCWLAKCAKHVVLFYFALLFKNRSCLMSIIAQQEWVDAARSVPRSTAVLMLFVDYQLLLNHPNNYLGYNCAKDQLYVDKSGANRHRRGSGYHQKDCGYMKAQPRVLL